MSFSLGVWQAMLATVYVADKTWSDGEFISTRRLADDLNIPAPSLARLLRSLNRAQIVETREGSRGGVRLAKSPDQVTLLAVLDAIEQQLPLFRSDFTLRVSGPIPERRQASLRASLGNAEQSMRVSLQGVTLADISSN